MAVLRCRLYDSYVITANKLTVP